MLKVALTGGIATGKSYVLEQFRRRGVPCLDADLLAHGVTAAGHRSHGGDRRPVRRRMSWPPTAASIAPGWVRIVFADPAARRELEAMVHPAVYRAITAGLRAFELLRPGLPLAVVDVPLLYESGHAGDFDRVDRHGVSAGECSWRGS